MGVLQQCLHSMHPTVKSAIYDAGGWQGFLQLYPNIFSIDGEMVFLPAMFPGGENFKDCMSSSSTVKMFRCPLLPAFLSL